MIARDYTVTLKAMNIIIYILSYYPTRDLQRRLLQACVAGSQKHVTKTLVECRNKSQTRW